MRRLQVLFDDELDDDLERAARRQKRSKSDLIREAVREKIKPLPPLEDDPITKMIGADSYEPADMDEVVYGA